jgi:hypothetical protein
MDELHGSLTTYEMRIGTKNEQSNKEATFKATKKKEQRTQGRRNTKVMNQMKKKHIS